MPSKYERLPTSPTRAGSSDSESESEEAQTQVVDTRFNPPAPSAWKRAALLLLVVFLFWLAFSMRGTVHKAKQEQVIHAKRYSKEFKFRPAASPVVTEYLKDGRIRLRGAQPAPR